MRAFPQDLASVGTDLPKGRPDHRWDSFVEGDGFTARASPSSTRMWFSGAGLARDWVSLHLDEEYAIDSSTGMCTWTTSGSLTSASLDFRISVFDRSWRA